jgi:sec-independent protein translocase protein TatA
MIEGRVRRTFSRAEAPSEKGGSMGEGLFSPLHILLIVGIALLLFGPSKFAALGKGLGEGIRNFKSAIKDGESDPQNPPKKP